MFSIQSAENLKVNRSLTLQPTNVPLSSAGPHIFLHGAFPRFPSCIRQVALMRPSIGQL